MLHTYNSKYHVCALFGNCRIQLISNHAFSITISIFCKNNHDITPAIKQLSKLSVPCVKSTDESKHQLLAVERPMWLVSKRKLKVIYKRSKVVDWRGAGSSL